MIFQNLTLFIPHFGVSALCWKCTKHVGCNNDVFSEECMWEQKVGGWAKAISWEGVSEAVVKMVMNWRVV